MAKTVIKQEVRAYVWWRAALLGVVLGILFWVLTALLNRYVVAPTVCQGLTTCSDSMAISGDIATILVAFVGLLSTIAVQMFRPLLVVVAIAIVAWGLGSWIDGLSWYEALGWSALLYGLGYWLFSWVANYIRFVTVVIWALGIVIVARIVFALV